MKTIGLIKNIMMVPIAIIATIFIINVSKYVYKWALQFNHLITMSITFVILFVSSVLLGVFFGYYCNGRSKLLTYTITPVLFCSLYYIIFVYHFSWFSFLIIVFITIYTAGIKNVLDKDFRYQLDIATKIQLEEMEKK
jgi:hypothetical protein